ncbi:hypothetical protein ABIA96_006638 [Bradyrhizobium sp. LB11.1]|jgi:hypothetical protein
MADEGPEETKKLTTLLSGLSYKRQCNLKR